MAVERVDYYSEEEYQHALQAEIEQAREEQAYRDWEEFIENPEPELEKGE